MTTDSSTAAEGLSKPDYAVMACVVKNLITRREYTKHTQSHSKVMVGQLTTGLLSSIAVVIQLSVIRSVPVM